MNAELKRMHSPDIDDLEGYIPADPANFAFLLQIIVGPQGEDGEESFNVTVCTPRWLEKTYALNDVLLGRHHLIVQEYNYRRLVGFIERFIARSSGENWKEVAQKLSRLGHWEFEDYKE